MNLVTIDTSPGNMSMYIAPNNTSYLEVGKNASTIIIGPLSQTGTANISTVINGVRIDSHQPNNNLFVSFGNSSYKMTSSNGVLNACNTAVSNWAFKTNSMTGHHCTAVGHNSLTKNSSGIWNTAIGADTLANVSTGSANTALGGWSLSSATDSSHVAVGYRSLVNSVSSLYPNVAVGAQTLENFNNSGSGANVAIGYQALGGLISGTGNVAIGFLADNAPQGGNIFPVNTGGSNNICIGNQATSKGNTNCIVLGSTAYASADNQIILGSAGGAHTTYIQGSGGLQVNGGVTLANTSITTYVNGTATASKLILNKNIYSNNTNPYDGVNGIIDVITTSDDTFTYDVANNNSTAKAIQIQGGNLRFDGAPSRTQWNKTGQGGHILIRAGAALSIGNDGNGTQTLNGGNIYIDSGTAACSGGVGSSVTANPGSIFMRCGQSSSGTTYYPSTYSNKMIIAPTLITTYVPMKIYEDIGSGTITESGIDSMTATSGSLVIQHGNTGGGSSIVFPSRNSGNDFGYIRYRSDKNNSGITSNERGRLEIGVENDSNDCLILNKNGLSVGIGTVDPAYTLDISGNGRATSSFTASSFPVSSDSRIKENITNIDISNAIYFVNNIDSVTYNMHGNKQLTSGYIAQDVLKHGFTHLVETSKNEDLEETTYHDFVSPKGIQYNLNYTGIIPYQGLVIKHLLKENEELKLRLSAIEARLAGI